MSSMSPRSFIHDETTWTIDVEACVCVSPFLRSSDISFTITLVFMTYFCVFEGVSST